jgi:hypothetical protein
MVPREELADLHQQVLAKDPTAPARLFGALRTSTPAALDRKIGAGYSLRFLDCEEIAGEDI